MTDYNHVIEQTTDMFDILTKEWEHTALAGGAVRDMIFNKPVKDLDFYVHLDKGGLNSMMRQTNTFEMLMSKAGYKFREHANAYEDPESTDVEGGIWKVYQVKKRGSLPMDVIFIRQPIKSYIDKHFDIGICEAYMDNSAEIYVSNNFREDSHDKSIRVRPKKHMSNHNLGRAIKEHLPRVVKKYNTDGWYSMVAIHSITKAGWSKL